MLPASPSPPPGIIDRRAPDSVKSVEGDDRDEDSDAHPRDNQDNDNEDASDLTSLDDDPALPASPSPSPGIIDRQANMLDRLSPSVDGDSEIDANPGIIDGDDEDENNDRVKSLAYTLNKAIEINASQDGLDTAGGNNQFKRPRSRPPKKLQQKAGHKSYENQSGTALKSLHHQVIEPVQSPQSICKCEVIDLTSEQVSFNGYFHLLF